MVLLHKSTHEYGVPFFGRDYGQKIMAWVKANYDPSFLFGQEPLQPGTNFGVRVAWRHGVPR